MAEKNQLDIDDLKAPLLAAVRWQEHSQEVRQGQGQGEARCRSRLAAQGPPRPATRYGRVGGYRPRYFPQINRLRPP